MTYWIQRWVLGTCSLTELTPKGAIIVDVRDLVDGWNEPKEIRKKAETILKCLSSGEAVIIRCEAGMGRSNALAVTVLCLMNKKHWGQNENLVRSKVPRTYINSYLRDCCQKALKCKKK